MAEVRESQLQQKEAASPTPDRLTSQKSFFGGALSDARKTTVNVRDSISRAVMMQYVNA